MLNNIFQIPLSDQDQLPRSPLLLAEFHQFLISFISIITKTRALKHANLLENKPFSCTLFCYMGFLLLNCNQSNNNFFSFCSFKILHAENHKIISESDICYHFSC